MNEEETIKNEKNAKTWEESGVDDKVLCLINLSSFYCFTPA